MKIAVTGSLGHISKPLTQQLVKKGHSVTVISSDPAKKKNIEDLGAIAAIGVIEDIDFLANAFTGAEAVYCMAPSDLSANSNHLAYGARIAGNYAEAITLTSIKRVVNLSSYGAHLNKNSGLIIGRHYAEVLMNEIPDISITHLRPAFFYYNLYAFTEMIKATGVIRANYGGDDNIVMVAPADIADVVAEELESTAKGISVRYIASDERTGDEIARVLGAAIGKRDLKWEVISDEQMEIGLTSHGMQPRTAAAMTEMMASLHNGTLMENYLRNRPAVMGKIKLNDFAKEFAVVFNQK
jgi:uncharacterized protein YbjT (DUF2867 family)